ncbi:MAG: lipid-A-disaccharide synthase [Thermodesulfovibrionales bacterium]
MKTVMIVAGESSGELYGSFLARALKRRWPDIRLIGIGGERMRAEGVELVSGLSHSFGFVEVLSSLGRLRAAFNRAKKVIDDLRPSVCVLIDYPDFNFRLGRYAKKKGIKVLYYVSPQVWAWRKGRAKKMKEVADRLAVILPFEEDIYKKEGINAEFVGHPAMEEIRERGLIRTDGRENLDIPVIALLPGSRPNELKRHLPVLNDLVSLIKRQFKKVRIILPLAPNLDFSIFEKELSNLEKKGVEITKGDAVGTLSMADAAVIASGTATIQAALIGVPMIVIYKLSPISYFLGRIILKVKYISLVNILAGKGIVPELIQDRARPEEIMMELRKILIDRNYRDDMVRNLNSLKGLFSNRNPSGSVTEMIAEMTGWI